MSIESQSISETLEIKTLEPADAKLWDAFVDITPDATFFHKSGWKTVIEQSFGHDSYFIYAESLEGIQGILPLVHIDSRLFGSGLISMPFCAYGGVVALTERARAKLHKSACRLATDLNVDYLECRNLTSQNSSWPTKDLYVTFRKSISANNDENMAAIPRKRRAMIRKGIKAGLISEIDSDIERFFDAYSQSVRNLGTPVFAPKYFRTLQSVFGSDCEILTIVRDGRAIASVLNFYFRNQVLPYYGGGVDEAREVAGSDFMYWEVMRRASDRGLQIFDFGRSKVETGSHQFKCLWGFEPEQLHYEYFLVNASDVPNVSPTNPRYRLFIESWKRLPLSITRLLGPLLVRNLG